MSTHCKANIETDIYTEQTEDFDRTAHVVATSNVDSKNEDDAEAVRHPPTISAALRDSEFSASLALSFFFFYLVAMIFAQEVIKRRYEKLERIYHASSTCFIILSWITHNEGRTYVYICAMASQFNLSFDFSSILEQYEILNVNCVRYLNDSLQTQYIIHLLLKP